RGGGGGLDGGGLLHASGVREQLPSREPRSHSRRAPGRARAVQGREQHGAQLHAAHRREERQVQGHGSGSGAERAGRHGRAEEEEHAQPGEPPVGPARQEPARGSSGGGCQRERQRARRADTRPVSDRRRRVGAVGADGRGRGRAGGRRRGSGGSGGRPRRAGGGPASWSKPAAK
ncbi:hypothetical protein H632_c5573p0, partial [Helicosporidium sp. ATCC 50920]